MHPRKWWWQKSSASFSGPTSLFGTQLQLVLQVTPDSFLYHNLQIKHTLFSYKILKTLSILGTFWTFTCLPCSLVHHCSFTPGPTIWSSLSHNHRVYFCTQFSHELIFSPTSLCTTGICCCITKLASRPDCSRVPVDTTSSIRDHFCTTSTRQVWIIKFIFNSLFEEQILSMQFLLWLVASDVSNLAAVDANK